MKRYRRSRNFRLPGPVCTAALNPADRCEGRKRAGSSASWDSFLAALVAPPDPPESSVPNVAQVGRSSEGLGTGLWKQPASAITRSTRTRSGPTHTRTPRRHRQRPASANGDQLCHQPSTRDLRHRTPGFRSSQATRTPSLRNLNAIRVWRKVLERSVQNASR